MIYISAFDVFGEGEMYYEIGKFSKKSMTPRRSPVTEIYINTAYEDRSDLRMSRIADLMKAFKDPERYDFDEFPEFSRRKKELKETEEGVLEVSSEYQKVIDNESEKASKDTLKLTVYLMKNGRDDDIEKAEKDPFYLKELLAEFRNGVLGAN